MARTAKTVWQDGIDRRATGYYATPDFVARHLSRTLLALNPAGRRVLDPCVGRGELLPELHRAGKRIDGFDLLDFDRQVPCRFTRKDFLAFAAARLAGERIRPLPHDYFIANPPYHCHEHGAMRNHRNEYSRILPAFGAKNSYALFLAAMVELAKPGALIGIVTLDSFLTASMYDTLRRRLLEACRVHQLLLCPRDLFREQRADVRTCLLILEKMPAPPADYRIAVASRAPDRASFAARLRTGQFEQCRLRDMILAGPRDRGEWIVECPADIRRLFDGPRLGDAFPCLTGISTGNDAAHLSPTQTPSHPIPFYKNPAGARFRAGPDCYLTRRWHAAAESGTNFLARNRGSLFREGISCSSMGVRFSAVRRPGGAAFGVNANIIVRQPDLWWLLGYLNSSLATYLARGVLLRSNMITSGYVARLPLPAFDTATRKQLGNIARRAWRRGETAMHSPAVAAIDACLHRVLGLSDATAARLQHFAANVVALS